MRMKQTKVNRYTSYDKQKAKCANKNSVENERTDSENLHTDNEVCLCVWLADIAAMRPLSLLERRLTLYTTHASVLFVMSSNGTVFAFIT